MLPLSIPMSLRLLAGLCIFLMGINLSAQEQPVSSAEDLAKKLANPVASLISAPFQNNMDVGIGTFNGSRNTLNIQPVVPIVLSAKMNLIARMVLPVISQHDITGENTQQGGLSDATLSAFFSPVGKEGALIWGAGPAFLVPTATNEILGTEKFGIGPTALALKQTNGWTIGALVNQLWSIAGADDRNDVNQMFVQPFFAYNWKSGAGLGGNFEITQNWLAETTTVFFNPTVSGVTKLGNQSISLSVGPRICVAAPDGARPDFGVRTVLVFVFPK